LKGEILELAILESDIDLELVAAEGVVALDASRVRVQLAAVARLLVVIEDDLPISFSGRLTVPSP